MVQYNKHQEDKGKQMSSIINLKIDVTKLTKDKLFKGEKGTYANITVAANMDGESEYGDTHYLFESQSKEEREAKTPKVYLGNGKEFVFNGGVTASAPVTSDMDDEDIPF